MSISYRPSKIGDAKAIQPQAAQLMEATLLYDVDWTEYAKRGFAITAVREDVPLAMAGVCLIRAGVGEGWMLLGSGVGPQELASIGTNTKKLIDSELETAYHRIQAYVAEGFEAGNRFADLLGMHAEGVMQDFPRPGDRYTLFARTR